MHVTSIIGEIVAGMRAQGSKEPYYEFGHPLEIIETLRSKSEASSLKYEKYPLVALFMDIKEKKGGLLIDREAEVTVLFITDTLPEYKAAERLEKTFNPILIPLWEQFKDGLKKHPYIHVDKGVLDISEYTEHMFWGKNGIYGTDGNIFDDRLDAIEVKINLKIFKDGC
jgi:hypothetical protein